MPSQGGGAGAPSSTRVRYQPAGHKSATSLAPLRQRPCSRCHRVTPWPNTAPGPVVDRHLSLPALQKDYSKQNQTLRAFTIKQLAESATNVDSDSPVIDGQEVSNVRRRAAAGAAPPLALLLGAGCRALGAALHPCHAAWMQSSGRCMCGTAAWQTGLLRCCQHQLNLLPPHPPPTPY